MDSSRMNRGCCGANNMQNRRAASNNMELKMEPRNFPRKMQHVDHMIPAMAYVPMQRFEQIYDLSAALKMEPYSRNSVNHSVEREEDSAYDAADAIPRKDARLD